MFLNRSNQPADVHHDWKKQVLIDDLSNRSVDFKQTVYRWSDLWSRRRATPAANCKRGWRRTAC